MESGFISKQFTLDHQGQIVSCRKFNPFRDQLELEERYPADAIVNAPPPIAGRVIWTKLIDRYGNVQTLPPESATKDWGTGGRTEVRCESVAVADGGGGDSHDGRSRRSTIFSDTD